MDQDVTDKKQEAKHAKQDTKEQEREGLNTNSRVEGQDRGRLGQTMGVERNCGQERMHRVDKIEGNSKEGKLKIWKEEGFRWG